MFLSSTVRHNQGMQISSEHLRHLDEIREPSFGERAEQLLNYFSSAHPRVGEYISILDRMRMESALTALNNQGYDDLTADNQSRIDLILPLLAVSWSENADELEYLIREYLYREMGYLSLEDDQSIQARISPHGWDVINQHLPGNPQSDIAFVAMWFDDQLAPIFETAIKPGIIDAGYRPIRIDQHEHINRIDDEIIALLRKSRFVVADFTGQRGGVYFESGFALGLGLPVFWICNDPSEASEELHFDVNHYNFIFWKKDRLDILRAALTRRIEAELGKGPR
ncbi:MAG: hypothetical protein IIA59_12500 [Candidatus Marinimicrobia bacterium]|nr:hypothetical protein [Candidatus Neomarinimicrobiota bacterium]